MNDKFYVGIDLGGMSAKAGLFDCENHFLEKATVRTSKDDGYEVTVKHLAELVRELCAKSKTPIHQVCGVGLGSPGVINGKEGVVVSWTNYNWENRPLVKDLSEELNGIPVKISNDANTAALGEAKFGAGQQYSDSVMITLGTGVGSGIIINNKIFEGYCGGGAEIGHITIVVNGRECPCGRRGCFEQYASATALMRETRRAMSEHKDSLMWKLAGSLEQASGRTPFDAAAKNDAAAQEVIDNYVMYLSEGILNIVNSFRPQAIIVGGGVSAQGENLLKPVRKYVDEHLFVGFDRIPLSIVKASLGNDAGIWGAYALAVEA